MTRREFVAGAAALPLSASSRVRNEVFLPSPGPGTAVIASAFSLNRSGRRMLSIEQCLSRSDTIDVAYRRTSNDYGRSWSEPVEWKTGERRVDGMLRRHPRGVWVDPTDGAAIEMWLEAVLPHDDPLEGLTRWRVHYRVNDGPEGIFGEPGMMTGDMTCRAIRAGDEILLPVSIQPMTPDGKMYNPGGGYTWHDAAVLHIRRDANTLTAKPGTLIQGDPSLSTRGWDEPTIAPLSDNRLLLVMRGSNDKRPELPGYKWHSVSTDNGWTWTPPKPWTFTDGANFFSPSACSQLLPHSSGRLFWLGNITPENPRGNRPRYPMMLGEVDRRSGLLKRDSLVVVDDLQPGEDSRLSLSNFYAREDSRSKKICLNMTRLLALPESWRGDAMLYQIQL